MTVFRSDRVPSAVAVAQRGADPSIQSGGGSPTNEQPDLLGQGLRLACFILTDRTKAVEVLVAALNKLDVQCTLESRRGYWRRKHLKGKITKISREYGDALQWLIYREAEEHERQKESAGDQSVQDMVVWYIKHLVQLTTPMSSLYVSVGLHRLLYGYSTPEVRRVYEMVTGHSAGEAEYRNVKGVLMDKLIARFQPFLKTFWGDRRELKFEVADEQENWVNLVEDCLKAFVPWSTVQACPTIANPNRDPEFPFGAAIGCKSTHREPDPDTTEVRWCHAFIDPACYQRLARTLGLVPPRDRLAVPRFFLQRNKQTRGGSRRLLGEFPEITDAERKEIRDRLDGEAVFRQRIVPRSLRIMAHGAECLRIDLTEELTQRCDIQHGVRLIEFWVEDDAKSLLFATHWLRYEQLRIARATATLNIGMDRKLVLRIVPGKEGAHGERDAVLWLSCPQLSKFAAQREFLQGVRNWGGMLLKYAPAALLLLVIGWMSGRVGPARELVRQRASIESLSKQLIAQDAARVALMQQLATTKGLRTFRLIPDTLITRDQGDLEEPLIVVSSQAPMIALELPVETGQSLQYRATLRPFLASAEILRENYLKPANTAGHFVVKVLLPLSLVKSREHYVVSLEPVTPSGGVGPISKFTFYIEKTN